jgi:D-inositol-3-phosphate glycosyltransferase
MVQCPHLKIAMFSIHSSPLGKLGTQDTGGMSVYIRELAKELGKQGHHIDIYTKDSDANLPQCLDLDNHVRLIHLSMANSDPRSKLDLYPLLPGFFDQINGIIEREGLHYDLAHSHYWLSGKIGCWAQQKWQCPHIATFHTLAAVKNKVNPHEAEPELRLQNEKRVVDHCDKMVVSSHREKTFLIQHYAADPQQIAVISCGVNLSRFRPQDQKKARRQLGLGLHEKWVLYVGRFAPVKGLERLLKAIAHLNRNDYSIRLLVVGGDGSDAPASKRLYQIIDQMGIRQQVRFVGRIDQMLLPTYYSAADVLALPSDYESFGLVCLEALACGTPVVATPVGAVESFINRDEFGAISENMSQEAFAQGILKVFNHSATQRKSEAIRASVLPYGWPRIASILANEYLLVLRRPRHEQAWRSSS